MQNRIAAFTVGCALITWVLPDAAAQEKKSPPNIVFFFADDQTASSLGCYGNQAARTPTIDALAGRGTRFENAFVSQSICWVSRTTILTGLTGRSYGTPGNPELTRPDAVASLYPDLLRNNRGYRTGFFGKWHAKMPQGFRPQDHFDEFEAIGRNPFFKSMPDGTLRHETDLIVDRGIAFLQNQPKDRPFALNMWFNACHAEDSDRRPGIGHFPWPESVDGWFDDRQMAPPRLNQPEIFESQPEFLKRSISRERFFWRWNTEDKYQTNMRAYYQMVSGIDQAMNRFLAALDKAGLTDNTIIVYSADNGYFMGNRGFAGKWAHYEESLRVPLIIADPRVPKAAKGKVCGAAALNLDLPSTFLDWAGVEIPDRYQGRSLKTLVEGKSGGEWRSDTFHEHFAVRHRIPAFEGVRTPEFKYVRYIDFQNREFLHDLKNDPDELVNLASDPKFQNTLLKLRKRTDQRVKELGGPLHRPGKPFTWSTAEHPEISANVGARPGPDGFISLFDGKGLRQWAGDKKYWSVRNGAITGTTGGSLKMNRFLTWKFSTVRNFDLRIKVKISAGGNSGIQYRGAPRPDMGLDVVSGYQCDIVADIAKYNGMLYEEKGRRILSHTSEKVIIDPAGRPWVVGWMPFQEFPSNQWHEYRILVRGNHHQHWIDGHPTVDLIDLDENGRALEGVLAMQVHVGPAMEVQFKDIRIKHLPDDLPLKTSAEVKIPPGAFGVRPQGKLPDDWKAPVYGDSNSQGKAKGKGKGKSKAKGKGKKP